MSLVFCRRITWRSAAATTSSRGTCGAAELDAAWAHGTVAALDSLGKMLISAGYDTTVRIWTVTEQIAAKPGQRVGARKETETRKK
jgi:hypothetical protein